MPVISDAFLGAVDQVRATQGPNIFGKIKSTLSITTRTWSGGRKGAPAASGQPQFTDSTLAVSPWYEFALLKTYEIASSGGRYEMGDIRVGPITPPFAATPGIFIAGGFSQAQLAPKPTTDGVEIIYTIAGYHAGNYTRVELRDDDVTGFLLILRRRTDTP